MYTPIFRDTNAWAADEEIHKQTIGHTSFERGVSPTARHYTPSVTIGVGYYYNCLVWKKWEPRNVVFVQNRRMAMRRLKRAGLGYGVRSDHAIGGGEGKGVTAQWNGVYGGVYAANRAGDRNNNRGNIITGSWGAVLLEDSIRTGTPAIARNIDANDF